MRALLENMIDELQLAKAGIEGVRGILDGLVLIADSGEAVNAAALQIAAQQLSEQEHALNAIRLMVQDNLDELAGGARA